MTSTLSTRAEMRGGFRRASERRLMCLSGAAVGLLCLVLLDLTSGPSGMPLADVWNGLLAGPQGADRGVATIL